MSTIRKIIDSLGYSNSEMLCYENSSIIKNNRSLEKLFEEIHPVAVYLSDNQPFIVFFESADKNIPEAIFKKIWNAQVPLLIISFENHVEIYNGCSIDNNKKLILLETIDNLSVNEKTSFSFWNITDAAFWEKYEKKLSTPKLYTVMLDNIQDATRQLKKTNCYPFAVKIMLRLIFIRYLIDRGIDLDYHGLSGNVTDSQTNLLKIMEDKNELYGLFKHLKERFNGNLFELYEENNRSEISFLENTALKILHDLMAGNLVLSSGQMSLFPLYDFNIIPIELISSIYQLFLKEEEKQKNDKAFYTPPYLANFILNKTIKPFVETHTSCKILDPACGSGIFLVESARILIERNFSQDSCGLDDSKLISVVTENLWGIDKSPEAIDIAIFSLYITILDYKDPKTLKNFKLPSLKGSNFFVSDFFSEKIEKYLSGKCFDFIIGNPPWGKIEGSHEEYCEKRKLPIQGKEISRSFVLRTKDFATTNTCCCLIVTSKLFYNMKSPSVNFRKWLLTNAKVCKYIELAAVRELIFEKVRGPAGVVVYRFDNDIESNKKNEICHLTLKPNIFFKLFNIIVIEKNDYKYIPQTLLIENDWAWKVIVFGNTNDFNTIKYLFNHYSSVVSIIKEHKLKHGTGISFGKTNKQHDANHLMGRWLINAKNGINPFEVIKENGSTFTENNIHRAKKDKQYLFKSPYVLIKKGFNIDNYKFRAAYSEEDFIYTDDITGICGEKTNKEILLCMAGLFNSSFYSYLNLMLGASSGIEREQGFPTAILKYPAIIDPEIAIGAQEITNTIRKEKENFQCPNESEKLIQTLDKLILSKFGLSCDVFVDYALNVQIPLIANNKIFWKKVTVEQLYAYATVFTDYFSEILRGGKKYISAHIYENITNHYCVVEFVFQDNEPTSPITMHEEDQNIHTDFVNKFRISRVNDLFYQIKDVVTFLDNSFYILKTNEGKNWHPAMAKLDLADVLNSILMGNEMAKS